TKTRTPPPASRRRKRPGARAARRRAAPDPPTPARPSASRATPGRRRQLPRRRGARCGPGWWRPWLLQVVEEELRQQILLSLLLRGLLGWRVRVERVGRGRRRLPVRRRRRRCRPQRVGVGEKALLHLV